VVLLGWDVIDAGVRHGILGFSIQRVDHTEGDTIWLRGMKTFPDTVPPLPLGGTVSSQEQPFQTFQWGDYAAKSGHSYTYTITAMYGKPGALEPGAKVSLDIDTEKEGGAVHEVYFNRGAIASQEYARRFQDKKPSEVGAAAYVWLSRGLKESITDFIARAVDESYALRVAIYEFQWPEILEALRAASARGASVQILYDAIENAKEDPVAKNGDAITAAGITDLCHGITNGKIMHNKFILLLKNGAPAQVLTGSTNYTENGLFGHLNCAHIVNDETVAKIYLRYWTELSKDLPLDEIRLWADEETPTPAVQPPNGITEVFSPQTGTATLKRYGDIAATARNGLFMTFAFGMNKAFLPTYGQADGVLRFALMDKIGSGANVEKANEQIAAIRRVKNTVVAIGQNITLNQFDRWLKEIDGVSEGEHVRWVHTKFMLVDPLSDEPVVITGSANFSDASINANHENMLVIKGDKRVADIYLSEFMRQFSSYAFRDAAYAATHGDQGKAFKPQDLATDDSWMTRYFEAGSSSLLRRLYFAGQ
jgi:phosphatidylserine/phosphatidylglycerophosphate/cardiolipin synthase-like enzyme